jgi:hypothetical protein
MTGPLRVNVLLAVRDHIDGEIEADDKEIAILESNLAATREHRATLFDVRRAAKMDCEIVDDGTLTILQRSA